MVARPQILSTVKLNLILGALNADLVSRLLSEMEAVELPLGQVLYESGDAIDHVYFPTTCIASLIASTESGCAAEVAMTGNDGFIGVPLVLGGESTLHRILVQQAGTAYRLRGELFQWQLDQSPDLRRLSLRYALALMNQIAQIGLCNRHHTVAQRFCRWLLMCADRLPGNPLKLTHESIANMLGVRREAITETAGKLQAEGLIAYSRGLITILDRSGLEGRVCPCYSVLRDANELVQRSLPSALGRQQRARPNPKSIRVRAEMQLERRPSQSPGSPEDLNRLVHELQVHQIELEMQNEELATAYAEADAAHNRYADIYDHSPVAYITVDALGVIRQINLTGAILLGIKRSQVTRHRFGDSVSVNSVQRFNDFLASVLHSGVKQMCEIELDATGQRLAATVSIDAVADESAKECHMVVSDVTRQRRNQEQLTQANDRLERAQRAAGAGVWDWDLRTGKLSWSDQLIQLFGLAPTVTGPSFDMWRATVHPADLAGAEEAVSRSIQAHLPLANEYRIVLPSGEVRWIQVFGDTVYDANGNGVRMSGICMDTTKRKQSEAVFQTLFQTIRQGVVYQDPSGAIRAANPAAERILGLSLEQMQGRTSMHPGWGAIHPDGSAFAGETHPASLAIKTGKPVTGVVMGINHTAVGHTVWIEIDAVPIFVEGSDRLDYVYAVFDDVTERRLAEEALRSQEEFFRMIAENADDLIAVLDLEGRRLYNSPSYANLLGDLEAMGGTDSFAEIHPDDTARVIEAFMDTVRSGRSHRLNYRFVLVNGAIRHIESCGGLIRNSQGVPLRVVVVSHDVTERLEREEEIRNLAFYDVLTQLPNRRLLRDRLDQAIATCKRSGRHGALMLLDLDNFKSLNDTHGHGLGDLLLVEVARRINSCVREMDTVARFGGDEFVVVLSDLGVDSAESAQQARTVAEKIRAYLAQPYVLNAQSEDHGEAAIEHRCTSSIGVVLFKQDANMDELLKSADMAMYGAKQAGRDAIRFLEMQA